METMYKLKKDENMILNKLVGLSDVERIRLIDRYSKLAEPIFSKYREETVLEIIAKLLDLKFNKYSLIDAFLEKDPVVDGSEYRLYDFICREFSN